MSSGSLLSERSGDRTKQAWCVFLEPMSFVSKSMSTLQVCGIDDYSFPAFGNVTSKHLKPFFRFALHSIV